MDETQAKAPEPNASSASSLARPTVPFTIFHPTAFRAVKPETESVGNSLFRSVISGTRMTALDARQLGSNFKSLGDITKGAPVADENLGSPSLEVIYF
jgi:hypothetical protein